MATALAEARRAAFHTPIEGKEISREDFEAYVRVQRSGVTNMFDVRRVHELSGLDRQDILAIMENYGQLKRLYMPEGEQ